MEFKKTEVVICLGSSCFARGNRKIVEMVKKYLKEKNLEDRVYFHGTHCFGNCEHGPGLRIEDREYSGVNEDNILEILNNYFNK